MTYFPWMACGGRGAGNGGPVGAVRAGGADRCRSDARARAGGAARSRGAHLNGSHGTLSCREAHKGACLARAAPTAHHEHLLDLAVLRKDLNTRAARRSELFSAWKGRVRAAAEGGRWGARHTCCRVCSSVPGGAPPTNSLFSGLGLERPTLGATTPPSTPGCIVRGAMRGSCERIRRPPVTHVAVK
jgi:hypothetical protein